MEKADKRCLEGIYRQGYGIVPKLVMHDRELSLESKAIYAYLCALAGSGDYTFPYRQTILRQLGITKNTYYRHYTPLIEQGYITVKRPPDKTAANIYTLIQNPKKLGEGNAGGGSSRHRCQGIASRGYGILPRAVMRDETLSIKAKGLYAYLCTYAGGKDIVFPRKDNILFCLHISEPTYYKILGQLKDAGYVTIQQRKENGRFGANVYFLNREKTMAASLPLPQKGDIKTRGIKRRDTEKGDDIKSTTSISITSNSIISPSSKTEGQVPWEGLADELMEELREKVPRENQAAALAARKVLLAALDGGEGEEALATLRAAFIRHLQKCLPEKRVRHLRAYGRMVLYNWLTEKPQKQTAQRKTAIPQKAASYDVAALERLIDAGDI